MFFIVSSSGDPFTWLLAVLASSFIFLREIGCYLIGLSGMWVRSLILKFGLESSCSTGVRQSLSMSCSRILPYLIVDLSFCRD